MCQLEMCFPLSFFDMMEHYTTHLAYQVFVLGPMYMHHMYLYECHMVIIRWSTIDAICSSSLANPLRLSFPVLLCLDVCRGLYDYA
jgi:hypothetical protein